MRLLLVLLLLAQWGQAATFTAQIPHPPVSFMAQGRVHLVYELLLRHTAGGPVQLLGLEAYDPDQNISYFTYEEKDLAQHLLLVARPDDKSNKFDPTTVAVFYCWITLEPGEAIPQVLLHKVSYLPPKARKGDPPTEEELPGIPVGKKADLSLGPILSGGEWWASEGPVNTGGLRKRYVRVAGTPYTPNGYRFASYWIKLGPEGVAKAGGKLMQDYYGMGAEVLACADATVTAVQDVNQDWQPDGAKLTYEDAFKTQNPRLGNYVLLNLGNGRFAVYGSLKRGSLRVKAGDVVKRGQVIGQVGSSAGLRPLLIFMVTQPLRTDLPSNVLMFSSEGYPCTFEKIEYLGNDPDAGTLWEKERGTTLRNNMPLNKDVVRFLTK